MAKILVIGMSGTAAAVVDRTLYGALQVLDGVTPPIGNEDLDVEFVLTARVSDRVTGQVIDEIELGPNGEGLCMGFSRVGRRGLRVGARLRLALQSSTYTPGHWRRRGTCSLAKMGS